MKQVEFWEEIDTSETRRERLRRYYNEYAVELWYKDIEEYYVKTKFKLLTKESSSLLDKNMNDFLKTVAQDMWYGQASKEYSISNNLPQMSGHSMIGK